MTPQEVLEGAVRYLRQYGWQQPILGGGWRDGEATGPGFNTCLGVAITKQGHDWSVQNCVRDAVCREAGIECGWNALYRWHDTPGRTYEEIISTAMNAKRWLP